MKKLRIIAKGILMFVFCLILAALSDTTAVWAEEYEPVSTDKLSGKHRFFAELKGNQIKDTLYFSEAGEDWYSYDIWIYTNDMAEADKEPTMLINGINDVVYYNNYIIYNTSSYRLRLYNTETQKDKLLLKGNSYFISDFKDGIIQYYSDSNFETVDLNGNKADWPEEANNAPAFKKTSTMKKVRVYEANGSWYAGVKLNSGKYKLYRYNGKKFKTVISSTKVPTTECYVVNGELCFLRKKVKGKAILYHLDGKKMVKAGSYDSDRLFGDDEHEIYVEGGYLVIKSQGDCYDSCYAFDANFKELYNYCYNVEIQPYIFSIKDGILYEDYYDEWDEDRDPNFRYNMIDLDKLR